MRNPRTKLTDRASFYHMVNRTSGDKSELPFDDVAKEHGFKLIQELGNYYLIETIAVAFMGNHFHIVAYAPKDAPSVKIAAKRHNDYHGITDPENVPNGKVFLDQKVNLEKCESVAKQMVDISCFMRVFQQRYTIWYNKTHNRRGSLWASRFECTVIEGSMQSLWNCVKYVELNPVRAGINKDPADYRFCSWGRYNGEGKHPFEEAFTKHMTHIWARDRVTTADILTEFSVSLAETRAWEDGKNSEEVRAAKEKAKSGDSMKVRFYKRTRYWTQGSIIGSKAFVLEIASKFDDPERVQRRQFSRGDSPEGHTYCLKRLRCLPSLN